MIPRLPEIDHLPQDEKLSKAHNKTQRLIDAINQKELPLEVTDSINEELMVIDEFEGNPKSLTKTIKQTHRKVVTFLQKQTGIVPKGYYYTLWISLGMSIFGIPIGMAISMAADNFGLIGVGFPIGMAIGMAIGKSLDQKALKEGKQLDYSENCKTV